MSCAKLIGVYSARLPLSPIPAKSIETMRKRLRKNGAMKLHQRACARKPCANSSAGLWVSAAFHDR